MQDTDLCKAKATIKIGRHTEAEVECGLRANHLDGEGLRNHVASNDVEAVDEKTGKACEEASIIFTWR